MVFRSICEHARGTIIIASTGGDQFCHASSEHLRNTEDEQRALGKFYARGNLFFTEALFCTKLPADSSKTIQQAQNQAIR